MDISDEESVESEKNASGVRSSQNLFDDPPFYKDKGNVAEWNLKNASNAPDNAPLQPDPWGDKLSLGHDALRNSEAYKWLVASIQNQSKLMETQPSQMNKHRERLIDILERNAPKMLKISRRRKPPVYTIRLKTNWDLKGFIRWQEYHENDLSSAVSKTITLAGDGQFVQALPCKEYTEQVWSSTGPAFVKLLDDLVLQQGGSIVRTLPDGTEIVVDQNGESVFLTATGTKYGLADLIEQFAWVSMALRPQAPDHRSTVSLNMANTNAWIFTADCNFRPPSKPEGLPVQHIGTADCYITYECNSLTSEDFPKNSCWHDLFCDCVIVSGYPIASRSPQKPGLDIPFDMMAALAGAERITPFGNNLVVKGFSTLLFPTSLEDDSIFWHLICHKDGSRISFADERIPLSSQTEACASETALSQLRPEAVYNVRHIVGWAPRVKHNIGKPI